MSQYHNDDLFDVYNAKLALFTYINFFFHRHQKSTKKVQVMVHKYSLCLSSCMLILRGFKFYFSACSFRNNNNLTWNQFDVE